MTRHDKPFTGSDVHAAALAWRKLTPATRETWEGAAALHAARGERTSPQAEFMASRLSRILRRRAREGR